MRQNVAQEEDRLQPRLEEFLKFGAGINIAGQAQLGRRYHPGRARED